MNFSRLLALVLSVVLATQAWATDVGGPVISNTTWTLAGSPYVVTNAIIVGGNATLTIQPGVTVKFNAGLGITVGSQAWGIGTLRAIGTAGQKITFTSNTNPGQPGQWKDIFFTDRCIDAGFDGGGAYLSGSTLQHCLVEFAGGGAAGSGAVTISQSSPFINFCEVRNNARSGIYADNTTTAPLAPILQIKNSNIHQNNAGSSQNGGGANLSVTGLLFTGNTMSSNTAPPGRSGGGLSAELRGSNSTHTVSGNTITNNSAPNGSGGGMDVRIPGASTTCTFSNNIVSNNTATGGTGGGISIAEFGGNNTVVFAHNTISSNTASGGGGGMYMYFGSTVCTLLGNTISNNSAPAGAGGGVLIQSCGPLTASIQNNNVFGNLAYNGGGLLLGSGCGGLTQFALTGNAIANNQARGTGSGDGSGGGLYILNTSGGSGLVVNLASNTITGNVADGGPTGGNGLGGGLYVTETLTSYFTTVNLAGNQSTGLFNVLSGNTADFGDAIYNNMLYNKNGGNDIQAGFVCWGGLDPNPTVSPNLIYDFFDNPQKSFVLYPPHVSGSSCATTPGCGPGLIPDCNGNCAPVSWIGDNLCDNGFYAYNGVPIYFNCQQFGNDGGDCAAPPPPIMNPPNRNVQETLPQYDDPTPPTPVQNKHIVIVHGWNTERADFDEVWIPFRDAVRNHPAIGPDWKVDAYDWVEASQTGRLYPDQAAVIANLCGLRHGTAIVAQTPQVTHVHLIGHSAGSAFVAAAAYQIKRLAALDSRTITVHTTYLDAYAPHFDLPGVGGYVEAYGGHGTDWSEHYYSREPDTADPCIHTGCLGGYLSSGEQTELYLPNSFNLDVSLADPDYNDPFCVVNSQSLSSHGWPVRLYSHSVNGVMLIGCEPPVGEVQPYGFPLSFAHVGGNVTQWIADMNAAYPPGAARMLPDGEAATSMALQTSMNPAFDLEALASFASASESVQVGADVLSMTTLPSGASVPSAAWINFQITTTAPANFVAFELTFTGDSEAAGLLTMYVNGTNCGIVDEPIVDPGTHHYQMPTPGDLAPGQHYLSFRLDHFNQLTSSVTIQNIATGFGEFVPACRADFDENGQVQVPDIFAFLSAWFAQDPRADFDGVPGIAVPDIFAFLSAWFAGCA